MFWESLGVTGSRGCRCVGGGNEGVGTVCGMLARMPRLRLRAKTGLGKGRCAGWAEHVFEPMATVDNSHGTTVGRQ